MRIVAIKERTIRLGTAARNANISFEGMTASALAVHTDVRKNGKPLIGLAFDSISVTAGGLLRERFIPRWNPPTPNLCRRCGGIDPHKAWNVLMTNESSAVMASDAGRLDSSTPRSGTLPPEAQVSRF
jgi:hypothetical protein